MGFLFPKPETPALPAVPGAPPPPPPFVSNPKPTRRPMDPSFLGAMALPQNSGVSLTSGGQRGKTLLGQ